MTRANQGDPRGLNLDGPCPATRRSFLAMMAALIGPAASAQDDAKDRGESAARLELMRRMAKEVKVREITEGKAGPWLALRPEPLLRFTNPTFGVIDGTQWTWGERGRPAAVMKLGLRKPPNGRRIWAFRVNVLSSKPIEVEFPDVPTWSSRKSGVVLRPIPDAPAPAESAAHRLIQAKDIARRFSASAEAPGPSGRVQLRLLPRPIARYSEPTAGLADGVLFNFVYAGGPTALLVLEAGSEGAGMRIWRFALVGQGYDHGEVSALFDGKPIWNASSDRRPEDAGLFIRRVIPASPEEQD